MKKTMKSFLLILTAVLMLTAFTSCDGSTIRTPSWLQGEFLYDDAATLRSSAGTGDQYFYGVEGTKNNIILIYKEKGADTNFESDNVHRYTPDEMPEKIDPTYEIPRVTTEGNSVEIIVSKDTSAVLKITKGTEAGKVTFSFDQDHGDGFKILRNLSK